MKSLYFAFERPLACTQKLLGHESLKSTQIYTEVNIKKLQEIHNQTHPAK